MVMLLLHFFRRNFVLGGLLLCLPLQAYDNWRAQAYADLQEVRNERRAQLETYFQRVHETARELCEDPNMQDFFVIWKEYVHSGMADSLSPAAKAQFDELIKNIRDYYIQKYMAFYDVLFVDLDGHIFFSIRQERDMGKNLFEGELADTRLSARLREKPRERFVDFEFYPASDEPSAFFVEQARVEGELQGWFVLQCPINKINEIFVRDPDLGETGEVLLVNERGQMLTQSRFRRNSSILQQELSEKNIRAKFAEGTGRMPVTDYRGYPVISSFEVCEVMGARWLLIAKRDEAEVLTRYFQKNTAELLPQMIEHLPTPEKNTEQRPRSLLASHRVDMDEFRKADAGESLMTWGVSTCTAIVLYLPGKFAYMGHASVYDKLYGNGSLDVVGHMLENIERFEIYPYQKRELHALIIAPHTESAVGAIKTLTDAGLLLSQVQVVNSPEAKCAAVCHHVDAGETWVEWEMPGGQHQWQLANKTPDLADVLRPLLP